MRPLADAVATLVLLATGICIAAVVDHAVRSRTRRLALSLAPIVDLLRALRIPDPGHRRVDRVLFFGAAPLALAAVAIAATVLPADAAAAWRPGPRLGVGIFFFLVVLDLVAVALFAAGWSANQRSGTDGAFLAAAQLVSYVVPLGFAVTGAVMAAESLAVVDAVRAQRNLWFAVWQPFGFLIYVVAAFGQTFRPPADLPLRDGSDALVEHRGVGAALLRIALYGIWFAAAAMGTVLFLGGWQGPWLPPIAWLLIKTTVVLGLMALIGIRFERLSVEQVIRGAWLLLLPASILNIVVVGVVLLFVR